MVDVRKCLGTVKVGGISPLLYFPIEDFPNSWFILPGWKSAVHLTGTYLKEGQSPFDQHRTNTLDFEQCFQGNSHVNLGSNTILVLTLFKDIGTQFAPTWELNGTNAWALFLYFLIIEGIPYCQQEHRNMAYALLP